MPSKTKSVSPSKASNPPADLKQANERATKV